jgi:hypothetical protein
MKKEMTNTGPTALLTSETKLEQIVITSNALFESVCLMTYILAKTLILVLQMGARIPQLLQGQGYMLHSRGQEIFSLLDRVQTNTGACPAP